MKPAKAIRKALEQPWLYNDEEYAKLTDKLKEIKENQKREVQYRRTTLGFMNDVST